ncbi:MAG: HD domain-containing protein [Actinobacteria bacterium]|nr:HD domain-containing protein [Actinomycetota bacterium]
MKQDRAVAEAVTRKFAEVVRLRDESLANHLHRTAEVACALGAQLGADVDTLDLLYTAGFLHDVGKLAISEAILWKPSGLTRAEWRVVREHPEEGHRLVADIMEREVASAVLNHHERMDGEGYPRGLDGRTLPMVARIVQVADAFDAMTNHRPYRPALPTPLAVEEVRRCAGSQFDAEVADALAAIFDGRPERRPPAERRHYPAFLNGAVPEGPPALVRLRDRSA